MKLSMWMIANRIESIEPELHIVGNPEPTLRSARLVQATDCAMITQEGNNVVCSDGSSRIILKNMSLKEGFELIQSVFDFYQDWSESISKSIIKCDYQELVNRCWNVFHNPMILFNGNYVALGMSDQYVEKEVDAEWDYILENRMPSANGFLKMMRENPQRDLERYRYHNQKEFSPCMSRPIRSNDRVCGRIILIQKEHELNLGDEQLVEVLAGLLKYNLGMQKDPEGNSNNDCISELLDGHPVSANVMNAFLNNHRWAVNDSYCIYVLTILNASDRSVISEQFFLTSLRKLLPGCSILLREKRHAYFVVMNTNLSNQNLSEGILKRMTELNGIMITRSLRISGINNLHFLKDQAIYLTEKYKLAHKELFSSDTVSLKDKREIDLFVPFKEYGVEYLLETQDFEYKIMATHPVIRKLWLDQQTKNDENLNIFWLYLQNGRSLKKTSEQLFIHRSTLVYRINKINEALNYNPEDQNFTDYVKLSIRLLRLADMKEEKITE